MKCGDSDKSNSKWRSVGICREDGCPLKTYKAIVREYLKVHAVRFEGHHKHIHSKSDSFKEVIANSAMAIDPYYKRHPHQWRVPTRALSKAKLFLLRVENQLMKAKDFEEIFDLVEKAIGRIDGVGELVIYDTALRIGTYRKLSPQIVYLHAGALKGAKSLGLECENCRIKPEELPPEFKILRPDQIEDCLCIYKDNLERIYQKNLNRD